ncbi:MAG: hypothetical protein JWP57_4093 [Spirosoma sp.]|nr:hypothetical protein [Spirosoma sp.]
MANFITVLTLAILLSAISLGVAAAVRTTMSVVSDLRSPVSIYRESAFQKIIIVIAITTLLFGVGLATFDYLKQFSGTNFKFTRELIGRIMLSDLLMGSFLAIIMTPWIMLNFIIVSKIDKETKDAHESRFRFLSIILGFLLVVAAVFPYFDRWMNGATNIEIAGIAKLTIDRSNRNIDMGAVFTSGSTVPTFREDPRTPVLAAEQILAFSRPLATLRHETAPNRSEIIRSLRSGQITYATAPTIIRDVLAIVYFSLPEMNAATNVRQQFYDQLALWGDDPSRHGEWAVSLGEQFRFFSTLDPALRCIAQYATDIHDFRLLVIDNHSVIRNFMVMNSSKLRFGSRPSLSARPDRLSVSLDAVLTSANQSQESILGFEYSSSNNETGNIIYNFCNPRWWADDIRYVLSDFDASHTTTADFQKALKITPYGAMATASLFTSIGAMESGISILASWLDDAEIAPVTRQVQNSLEASFSTWMQVRAVASLDALMSTERGVEQVPSYRPLLEVATKNIERLRPNIGRWYERNNCGGGPTSNDIYRQTEETIHLFYATTRASIARTMQNITRGDDQLIDEIGQYSNLPDDCFATIPAWRQQPEYWKGMFLRTHAEILLRRGIENLRQSNGVSLVDSDLSRARESLNKAKPMLTQVVEAARNERDRELRPDGRPKFGIGALNGGLLSGSLLGAAELSRVDELLTVLERLAPKR